MSSLVIQPAFLKKYLRQKVTHSEEYDQLIRLWGLKNVIQIVENTFNLNKGIFVDMILILYHHKRD